MNTKHKFEMHANLLRKVIEQQAGTLTKAALEAVMNSADAGATECRITLDTAFMLVQDNGKGFKDENEIHQVFKVFGQPQTDAQKLYGEFRMGRGQLFAFGRNQWKSGDFVLKVDVRSDNNELGFELEKLPPGKVVKGCTVRVDLYEELTLTSKAKIERDLADWVKWVPMQVYLNDVLVSSDMDAAKWDHETDEAYIKLKQTGGLAVYNQGVRVMEIPGHRYGVGGEVVTKIGHRLKVNFARNDVMSDCPVWKKLHPLIDTKAAERTKGKRTMNDDERLAMADRFRHDNGIKSLDDLRLKLITAVTGRQYSITDFVSGWRFDKWTVCPRGNRIGDKLMKNGLAFVLADETLERFGFTDPGNFRRWCLSEHRKVCSYDRGEPDRMKFIPFDELRAGFTDSYTMLSEDDLTPTEKVWLRLLQAEAERIKIDGKSVYARYTGEGRRLAIGESDVANGWTDAATYVAVGREFLAKQELDVYGITRVAHLLVHEACHQEPDMADHDHDQAFYERFHDACRTVGDFIGNSLIYLSRALTDEGRKMTKRQLQWADHIKDLGLKSKDFRKLAEVAAEMRT